MRTSAEVEAEVEASRNDLDRNVEALKQKMTPGQIFDEATRAAGGAGQQIAAKFLEQAKANPMPLAVIGAGLAWLMMSNGSSSRRESDLYGDTYGETRSFASTNAGFGDYEDAEFGESGHSGTSLAEKASDAVSDVKDKAQGVIAGVRDKLSSAKGSAADGGRSAAQGLTSAAQSVRQKAGQFGQHAQRRVTDTLDSEPLMLAGVGIIVGAAIGAALPRTETEDRVLGSARDRMLEKGKGLAQTGMEKASAAAQATYDAAKSELQNTDDGRDAAQRLADAARSGVQAAQENLQGSAH
jgi:hypothetical protein